MANKIDLFWTYIGLMSMIVKLIMKMHNQHFTT